ASSGTGCPRGQVASRRDGGSAARGSSSWGMSVPRGPGKRDAGQELSPSPLAPLCALADWSPCALVLVHQPPSPRNGAQAPPAMHTRERSARLHLHRADELEVVVVGVGERCDQ